VGVLELPGKALGKKKGKQEKRKTGIWGSGGEGDGEEWWMCL